MRSTPIVTLEAMARRSLGGRQSETPLVGGEGKFGAAQEGERGRLALHDPARRVGDLSGDLERDHGHAVDVGVDQVAGPDRDAVYGEGDAAIDGAGRAVRGDEPW